MHNRILLYLQPFVDANIGSPIVIDIHRETQYDADTILAAVKPPADLDCTSMPSATFVGWLLTDIKKAPSSPVSIVPGSSLVSKIVLKCPFNNAAYSGFGLPMFWYRFHAPDFQGHASLLPRVSFLSSVVASAMDESSSLSSHIVAEQQSSEKKAFLRTEYWLSDCVNLIENWRTMICRCPERRLHKRFF